MFNEANKPECGGLIGGWTTVSSIVKSYGTTVQATEQFIKRSVAGEIIMLFAIKRDEEGNDEKIVGTLAIENAVSSLNPTLYTFSDNNDEALLGRFTIDPKYQSKGLGRLLVDTGMKAMKDRDILLNWYLKMGFSDTHVLVPWTMPDQFEMIQDIKFKLLAKTI
ncbi:hypothetical protein EDC96DRAFT_545310 [Choanephora cucurbitarum]|nr:hypothetical protein EDC96DRAFT_545310 [Choanephora cucurbitarum]